ncbi:MAG: PAS domain-containing protein, partial [Armatimonadota bacterium]
MHEPLRTLIVEDSEDDALLVVRELQRGGHAVAWERVETAEAMRAALQEQNWDIVIADYCLPQFDAPSALALVQQSGLDLPFIVVSGTVGEDLAVTMMRQGVHDYFTKDSLSRLAPAVERELREAKERHRLRAAEQKLRQSEERYRRLVESAAEAIFVVDENGRFLSANRQAALDMGTTPEALVEKTLYDCFPQGLADQHVAAIRSVFRSGAPLFGRESLTPTAYGDRWYCTTLAPVTDEDGDVTCVLGIARDVTERRRAEDALRASEERYRSVVDNIAVGVAVISPEMEILGLNEEMQRRFPHIDTSRRPLCHRSLYDPPRESVCSYCPTSKTFQDGQVHEAVAVRGKGAEARYYRILASPLRDASGEVIAAIEMVEDITDRKRADDAMLRVSKLDSLALLAGGIAHDFNNVLTGIMGNVSLAKMHAGSDRTVGRALERAQKACRQATHLTHQLLTFAKGGAPVRAPASLA